MSTYFDSVAEAAAAVRKRLTAVPDVSIVLGTGLGAFAGRIESAVTIPYGDLPHWPTSGVPGHAGTLVAGAVHGRPVLVLSGRAHLYEGHDPASATFAVRVLGALGVRVLVLTNAAGGINLSFGEGALMVIDDHINLTGRNPLVGPNDDRWGPRFPDMSEVYAHSLRAAADRAAETIGHSVAHGVYAGLLGPSFETPAEIRYLRTIGADAVGMSTVLEAIVARHMRIDVLGISCITNMAAGILPQPLTHEEVMTTATRVSAQFMALLEQIVGFV
jgi:purine-nucleoside phosphorylase